MKTQRVWATAGAAMLALAAASAGYLAGTESPAAEPPAAVATDSARLASEEGFVSDGDFAEYEMFEATAYCDFGFTRSGILVRRGMAAADPNVLPIGSIVEIEAGDYSGIYVVLDTGTRVRGKSLDIYVSSREEAIQFGRQEVKVRVLRRGWHPEAGGDLRYSVTVAG